MTVAALADKDRIFTNLYGFQSPGLKEAQGRGDWDNTAELMKQGPDECPPYYPSTQRPHWRHR